MSLKRIQITAEDKQILETISGQSILLKNTFEASSDAVKRLMEQASLNAVEYLKRRKLGHQLDLYQENNLYKALLELQNTLGMPKLPSRIECFDISHLQGTNVYGSMVVFVSGKPAKSLYRLFKTKQQNNDYENLSEVLRRRFERYLKHKEEENSTWKLPELIVIDGGRGQLSSIIAVYLEYLNNPDYTKDFAGVTIVSLAKKEELVFVPETDAPVVFTGITKFLLQRLRDETHRFGITRNRKSRLKAAQSTTLEDIAGVGSTTAIKLLKEFGSVENLAKELTQNQTYVIEFAGESITKKLIAHFGK